MPSDTEEGGTPPLPKSKQERIRDNQRRSRARRQEYLAELERRLAESQLACREADIQRTAFLDLQIENAKLRELLALADVNEQFIQQYVSQAVAQSRQFPQDPSSALRQIKPKIPSPDGHLSQSSAGQSSSTSNMATRPPIMAPLVSSPVPSMSISEGALSPTTSSNYVSNASYVPSNQSNMSSATNYSWSYQQTQPNIAAMTSQPFRCATFNIQTNQPVRMAGENTVPCSVAKQMIEQHRISDLEWQQIKAKLATGLCRPARAGADCAIDNHVLYQVLQQLGSRYT